MALNVSLDFYFDQRRSKKDETFPVKLRLTFQRKQKYYYTGIDLSQPDWEEIHQSRVPRELKEIKSRLSLLQSKAKKILSTLEPFSFTAFEKQFLGPTLDKQNLYQAFEAYVEKLREDSRIGTAFSYNNALRSLRHYKKTLQFSELTVELLNKYEKWMLSRGKSLTTVGIYLRSLRSVVNLAIEKGIVRREDYPFGKRKYQIPAGKNIKKALTLSDIEKIYYYEPLPGSNEEKARDLWLFSYLCNGMNFKDIARLKYKNLDKDQLIFIRAKTQNTKRMDQKPIVVFLTEDALAIINRWGNKSKNPDNFIFPILKEGLSAEKEMADIKQFNKVINKYMRRIAQQTGIEKDITTYTARHSFATVLKRSGASIEFIQEGLGHSDKRTTQVYMDSFEDELKKEFAQALTAFKKSKSNLPSIPTS